MLEIYVNWKAFGCFDSKSNFGYIPVVHRISLFALDFALILYRGRQILFKNGCYILPPYIML